jgi:hypothetical protein
MQWLSFLANEPGVIIDRPFIVPDMAEYGL